MLFLGEPAVLSEYAAYLDDALKTAVLPHWQSVVDQERGGYNVEIGEEAFRSIAHATSKLDDLAMHQNPNSNFHQENRNGHRC